MAGPHRDRAGERGRCASAWRSRALLCLAELVGGWLTNSLALLSDAAHMFTDVGALALALFAVWIRRTAGERAARRSATIARRSWRRW